VPDFIPEQHEEGLKLGPSQIAEEHGALGRDSSRRAELHGEESSMERRASWRNSPRRGKLRGESLRGEKRSAELMSSRREVSWERMAKTRS
jgi:hypothetical protein